MRRTVINHGVGVDENYEGEEGDDGFGKRDESDRPG